LHGLDAIYVETIDVEDRMNGETVWEQSVAVFDLIGHPKASRAYSWSRPTAGTQYQFYAVLHVPPVDSPLQAVRAAVVAEAKAKRN
jgi:hypothetical protein